MLSRIFVRILATRLRKWAEDIGALDENQAGFRQARSTANATVCLHEDTELLQLSDSDYINDSNTKSSSDSPTPQESTTPHKQTYAMGNSEQIWIIEKHHKQAEGST